MIEVLRNVAPFMQPQPKRNPGGDCFACALTAGVNALFPENPVPFDEAWQAFEYEQDGKKYLSNIWPTMYSAAHALSYGGRKMEIRRDLVIPSFDIDHHSHLWWDCVPVAEWAYRLEGWLSSGWIAFAEMDMAGRGLLLPDGRINGNDHFVVLDGQRHFWKKHESLPAASLDHETHVVCSARGAYWIRTQDLLRKHGCAGLTLIRRDNLGEWR